MTTLTLVAKRPAGAYAIALRRTMARRSVGVVALAEAAGVSRVTIRDYRDGRYLPRTKTAYRIAEALNSSLLFTMVTQRRQSKCDYCGSAITGAGGGGSTRRWCNTTCRDRFRHHRVPRVAAESAAIARMCAECEPQGVCYHAACPLRPFSPLPLVEDSLAPLARQGNGWSPLRRLAEEARA